jgi:hypothetical protein
MKPDSIVVSGMKDRWKSAAFIAVFILFLPVFSSGIEDERFSPFIEKYPTGWIDWKNGIIYGVGRGYLHLNNDSEANALRAARVIASGNILKVAAGVRLDDRRTLEALGKERVVIDLKALIRYREYKKDFIKDDKRPYYEITLQAPITGVEGLTSMLITKLKTSSLDWIGLPKQSAETISDDEDKPWLVLDARDLPKEGRVKPAIFPKIISETGEVLYEPEKTDESALVQRGMAKYVVSEEPKGGFVSGRRSVETVLERAGFLIKTGEAVAGEPVKREKRKNYIVKDVTQAQGLTNTNLILSAADAQTLKSEDASSRILRQCRVIVIVSSPIGGIEGNIKRFSVKS